MRRFAFSNAIKSLVGTFGRNSPNRLQRAIFSEVRKGLRVPQPSFPAGLDLPEKYGRGLPERVIELLLARLIYRQGAAVLDVGHANSMACHLEMIKSLHAPRNISGIDIAQPVFDVSKYYSDSICGDVADSGFPDGTFDVIWCISALEHFGMDNSQYAAGFSGADSCASAALREMIRIAQPHGQVLVTVPFGKYENHGWFLNFDREHWQNLLCSVSHDTDVRQLYFRHTSGDGWAAVDPFELTHTGYYDQSNSGAGGLAVALITKL